MSGPVEFPENPPACHPVGIASRPGMGFPGTMRRPISPGRAWTFLIGSSGSRYSPKNQLNRSGKDCGPARETECSHGANLADGTAFFPQFPGISGAADR